MQALVPRGTDSALSRLEREFESRWERHQFKALPILVKPVLGSRVPRNANACGKNLTRLPRTLISRRLARFGLYHILQVTDPVRGRMELRYVRGYPEPLTVQFCLFEPLACAVLAGTAFEKGRLPRRRVA